MTLPCRQLAQLWSPVFFGAGIVLLLSLMPRSATSGEQQLNKLTQSDLSTANGSARLGVQPSNIVCTLTSTEARVRLEPDTWDNDTEASNWTAWLTAFDDNVIESWLKRAPLDAQETVSIRIYPDSTIQIINNTFLPAPNTRSPEAQAIFEAAIAESLNDALKKAKTMPATKAKLKEIRMSLTFMRDYNVVPRIGQSEYGFVATCGEKKFVTVYERTSDDGRFPGIQVVNSEGQVLSLEKPDFDKKVAELEQSLPDQLTTAPTGRAEQQGADSERNSEVPD